MELKINGSAKEVAGTVIVPANTCKGFELRGGYADVKKELLLYLDVKVEYIKASEVEDFIKQIRDVIESIPGEGEISIIGSFGVIKSTSK